MSQGFIKLPREFLQSDDWQSLNPINRTIFLILLEQATFEHREFNNLGEVIELKPGDICISRSRLLKLCPKGITDKKLRLSILSLNRSQLVQKRAKKRAKEKMVLSITNPIIYNACFSERGQEMDQEKGQRRAKEGPIKKEVKNEKKEQKEKVKKENSEIFEKKEPEEERMKFLDAVSLTKSQHQKLQEVHKEDLPAMIELLDSWLVSGGLEKTKNQPNYCYGVLKKGGWVYKKHQKEKAESEVKKASFTVTPNQISFWEKAKTHAENVAREYSSPHAEIELNANGIVFIPITGQSHPVTIMFKEHGFESQVDSMLRKKGFTKKIQPINENADAVVNCE